MEEEEEDFLAECVEAWKKTQVVDFLQLKDSAVGLDGVDNEAAVQGKAAPVLDTEPAETRSLNKRWEVLVPWDRS